jgi:hypothetical protein
VTKPQGQGGDEFSFVNLGWTNPEKSGAVWPITFSTQVRHKSKTPPSQRLVLIWFLDGKEIGKSRTDRHGRSQMDHVFTKVGRYDVEVQIENTSYGTGDTIKIPEEKPKEPKAVEWIIPAEASLGGGKWLVSFQALDVDNKPIQGVAIEVLDSALPGRRLVLPLTDKFGFTTYEVTFGAREKERYFEFRSGKFHDNMRLWR